jgi:hypothetical protein
MRRLLIFILTIWISLPGFAQITRVEYFLNTDPGVGKGTPLQVSAAETVEQSFNIPLTLPDGFHKVGFRAKDSSHTWSHTFFRSFYVKNQKGASIKEIEYFIDKDPGKGKANLIASSPDESGFINYKIPLSEFSEGFHLLGIRSKDNEGHWSQTTLKVFFNKKGHIPPHIVSLEYHFTGQGAPEKQYTYKLEKPSANIDLDWIADLSDLPANRNYTIHVIAIDENGGRSSELTAEFFVGNRIVIEEIKTTDLTCFDSGDGKVEVTASLEGAEVEYSLNNNDFQDSGIFENLQDGEYIVYIRSKENAEIKAEEKFTIKAPAELKASFSGLTAPVCPSDQTGSFSITATGGTSPYSYKLSTSSNYNSENNFLELTAGNYIVQVRDANGCETEVEVVITSENQAPAVPTISIQGTDGISTEVSFMSSSAEGNQWIKDGVEIPGATGQSLEITQPGSYQVKVTGSSGCSSISEVTVITSTPEIRSFKTRLFPNPAGSFTTIDFGTEVHIDRVVIYDVKGVVIKDMRQQLSGKSLQLDLEGYSSGNYIIQIEGLNIFERIKLIKQ